MAAHRSTTKHFCSEKIKIGNVFASFEIKETPKAQCSRSASSGGAATTSWASTNTASSPACLAFDDGGLDLRASVGFRRLFQDALELVRRRLSGGRSFWDR